MSKYMQLRKFKKDELVFNADETKIILKFIFGSPDTDLIESMTITDPVREFAQGLLVEAIDASYAIGFVEAIFRSTANPSKGAIKILKSFGKKAARHWFKHANVHDLQNVKVYDFVRNEIARRFRNPLRILASTASLEKQPGTFLSYNKPSGGMLKAWG
ncbi:MAG: hypothetical protein P8176_02390 [Gammaproteobacteria bacterium]